MSSRREFLRQSAVAGGLVLAPGALLEVLKDPLKAEYLLAYEDISYGEEQPPGVFGDFGKEYILLGVMATYWFSKLPGFVDRWDPLTRGIDDEWQRLTTTVLLENQARYFGPTVTVGEEKFLFYGSLNGRWRVYFSLNGGSDRLIVQRHLSRLSIPAQRVILNSSATLVVNRLKAPQQVRDREASKLIVSTCGHRFCMLRSGIIKQEGVYKRRPGYLPSGLDLCVYSECRPQRLVEWGINLYYDGSPDCFGLATPTYLDWRKNYALT
jgi:hypothetical protein